MLVVLKNPDEDIWKENPSLELITEFKKFKEEEGHDRSSDIIKAIYYIWDPKSDLQDSGVTEADLIKDINTNLLGDADFDWDAYEDIKTYYLKHNISEAERLLLTYKTEIQGLNDLLNAWKWTQEDASKRATLMKTYKSLFEDYLEIKEQVDMEHEHATEMFAGYSKSRFEQYGNQE